MNSDIQLSPIRFVPIDAEDPEFIAPNVIRWRVNMHPQYFCPPTDLIETADHLIVRVEIAGMHESDFSIRIDPRRVIVSGHRPAPHEQRSFHRMEIPFGEFMSEVELPHPIDVNQTRAEYKEGFLTILLPKTAPRNIPIRSESSNPS